MRGDLSPNPGSITTTSYPDATLVRLRGEIDAALRQQASSALARTLQQHRPVVVDTSEVTFIDPAGLSFLIQCGRIGHAHGLSVTLDECAPCVQELLDLVGATGLFDHEGLLEATSQTPPASHGDAGPPVSTSDEGGNHA